MSEYIKYKDPALSPEERAEDLLSRMTLREKIAQLDMKFGSNYCMEKEENDNCSVKETSDYNWDLMKKDFPLYVRIIERSPAEDSEHDKR